MPKCETPDILSSDLASTLLNLAKLRLPDVMDFPFMDKPHCSLFVHAADDLQKFGAVDAGLNITEHGLKVKVARTL